MTTLVSSLEAIFTADTTSLMSGLRTADRAISGLGDNLKSVGSKITGLGASLGAVAAPAVGLFSVAANAAMGFDEAMTNANSILQLSQEEIGVISDEILAMGSNAIAGPQAVAEAYYDIVSGVTDATTHMDILNTSIAVSEANSADLTGVTNAMVSAMNAYGFAADDAAFVGDVFTRTIGMGVVTGDELAASLGNVTGMANTMGISFNDLGAYIAYMTTQGVSASEATTQLSGMMTALLKPTEMMEGALAELGFSSGQAAVDALGLAGTYQALDEILTDSQMSEATGRVEAFRGALTLTKDGANAFFDTFSGGSIALHNAMDDVAMVTENVVNGWNDWEGRVNPALLSAMTDELEYTAEGMDSYTEAARKVQRASPAAQFKLMKSQVAGLAIEVGTALMPAMMDLFDSIKPVLTSVIEWVKENPQLISQIAMFTFGLAAVAAVLVPLGMVISAVGSALTVFGAVLGFILSPIGLVVAALALLAYAYTQNFMGIQDTLAPVMEWLRGAFESAVGWISDLVSAFQSGGLSGVATLIGAQIMELASSILNADWGQVWANIKTKAGELWTNFKDGAVIGADFILSNIVTPLVVAIASTDWGDVWEQMKQMAGKLINAYKDALIWEATFIYNNVVTPLANLITTTDWGQVWTFIKEKAAQLITAYKDALVFEATFLYNNIAVPLANLITTTDWSGVYNGMITIGTGIVQAMADAISGGISIIEGAVKSAINAAIPDHVGFSIGGVEVAGRTVVPATNVGIDIPNPFPGYKTGTSWTGNMSRGALAGVVHGQEAVIPTGGMVARVVPSPDGLQVHTRGGGGGISIGTVNVYGVQNVAELYEQIQKEAQRHSGAVGVW